MPGIVAAMKKIRPMNRYPAVSTGHIESVRVVYDPEKISFKELLDTFWRYVDPTDPGGQFADRGDHYKTAIFYSSEEEKKIAEQVP